jgi:CubicO group peptidase (beta-lactamase class C family)
MKRDYWPTDDWREASLESLGMNAEFLIEADKEIRVRYRTINAFLIVKHGYLVFERYYNGFEHTDSHHVASVTKSFTSALIGIAIDKGYIKGVEQKVLDFFPEFVPHKRDYLKKELTIKHLLTMTAGFQWRTGARSYESGIERMKKNQNWVEFILALPVKPNKVGTFQYNSAASHLLSAIITKTTGVSAREFANQYIFEPIGIRQIPETFQNTYSHKGQWPQDPQGNSTGGWGLALMPRDMARFGYLYLNYGQWNDKQVISRQWILDSTKAYSQGSWGDEHQWEYGYQWWLRSVKDVFTYAAVGRGGHHIFCLPEKDLVVVIASKQAGRWRERWSLLEEYIIPAVGNRNV